MKKNGRKNLRIKMENWKRSKIKKQYLLDVVYLTLRIYVSLSRHRVWYLAAGARYRSDVYVRRYVHPNRGKCARAQRVAKMMESSENTLRVSNPIIIRNENHTMNSINGQA